MSDYYSEKLSSKRLRRVYEIAPPRVQQYLQAEIRFLTERLLPSHSVLELGCGYGRVLRDVAEKAAVAV
ncbi:MAG: class I SAM-dependent methyltransferase, partial [candidate division Zixibacteria bacterium]|nr:class I SAM-dependent methyltransferase [candidate division Zixibacteria bacterium]